MDRYAKEFRDKYKVDINITIEEYIKQEQIKIRTDKNLTDKQKKERLEALQDIINELEDPNTLLIRRNENAWEK